MYFKHVSKIMRSDDIVVYLVGGNPVLAQMFLQWLCNAETNDMSVAEYVFESKDIVLPHQGNNDEVIEVDTQECMKYLLEMTDPKKMLKGSLISD